MYRLILIVFLWISDRNHSNALTCLNCPGIRHPRFCEYVKECGNDQVCGLERKVENNGAVLYNVGCMYQNICNSNPTTVNGSQTCFHCCSTDLCNTHGCGEQDFTYGNGTLCYSCLGEIKGSACQSITFCDSFETCYIEEKTHFGENFYHSGCKEKHICDSQFLTGPVIGRREVVQKRSTTSFKCCGRNLCNKVDYVNNVTPATTPTSIPDTTSSMIPETTTSDICSGMQRCFNGGSCITMGKTYTCKCREGYIGEHCNYSDGKDQDFIVIFHQGFRGEFSRYVPKILTSSTNIAHLSLYNFADSKNISITMDKDNFEHTLEKNVLMKDGISNSGVKVHSNVSINMYGFLSVQSNDVSEGFLVIPTRFSSKSFVVPTYSNFYEGGIIAISPLHDKTVINIQLKLQGTLTFKSVQYSNDDVITTVLNKYNTIQLSSTSDMSGTMVTSSKPVVVVSGNTAGQTRQNRPSGTDVQPFMEMVLPADQLDNLYIIPQISTRSNNTVRIQAVTSTIVSLKIGNKKITKTLNSRDHYDFFHTTVSYINSSENILVMIYPHELSGSKGDSFMMTIHGVHQYLPEYDFAVPTGFTSYISIAVSSENAADFILDGQNININNIYSISEGLDNFSTFSVPITSGVHRIEHSRNVRFGLWVYGYDYLDAYGYPAGVAFRTRD